MATVLQVGKYYPPVQGGIENHVHALATGLASRFDVTALVFNTEARTRIETLEGIKVVRAASLGKLLSTELSPSFLGWFLRLRRADLIHLHSPNPLGELACLLAPRSARLIMTYHSDVVRQKLLGRVTRFLVHRVIRKADRVIVFTRRYMESSPVLRRHVNKCAIIPHGVDLEEMRATPPILDRAAKIREAHGGRLVLFVGRLVYYKGIDVLLRSLARLPDARLVIVGDGPLRQALVSQSLALGLGERVTFLGHVTHEEKVAYYHAARVLVLPATHRSEAFGLVQVEAMACGLPVISTNIDSGVPFVNRHEETGLVVEPGDAEGLTESLAGLLEDDPRCALYGSSGRKRVEALFSREVMERDVAALYQELLDQHAGVQAPHGASPGG